MRLRLKKSGVIQMAKLIFLSPELEPEEQLPEQEISLKSKIKIFKLLPLNRKDRLLFRVKMPDRIKYRESAQALFLMFLTKKLLMMLLLLTPMTQVKLPVNSQKKKEFCAAFPPEQMFGPHFNLPKKKKIKENKLLQ